MTRWLPCRLARRLAPLLLLIGGPWGLPAFASAETTWLRLDAGALKVDIYRPDLPTGDAALIAHGFLRSRGSMADHASALAAQGMLAVVPDFPNGNTAADNAQALQELVARLRNGSLGAATDRVVLVGFSAGALAALLAAATPGVIAYIGLDPVDLRSGIGLDAARRLQTPAVLLYAPPSPCNAQRSAAPWDAALPGLVDAHRFEGASHCDFEAPSDGICARFCGSPDPQRQGAIGAALLAAVQYLRAAPTTATAIDAGSPGDDGSRHPTIETLPTSRGTSTGPPSE